MFNTKFIILNTTSIISDTQFIIFDTKSIMFDTKSIIFDTKSIIINTKFIIVHLLEDIIYRVAMLVQIHQAAKQARKFLFINHPAAVTVGRIECDFRVSYPAVRK